MNYQRKYCHQKTRWTCFQVSMLFACLFSSWSACAVEPANSDSALVIFFKQAISSPPEIEKFVAKRTNLLIPTSLLNTVSLGFSNSSSLKPNSIAYFEGAESGTNFYLHNLPGPDLPVNSNFLGTVSARSGSSAYEIGGRGIIYGVGENGLTEDVKANFHVARQILGLGIGEIEPETVSWNGNEFSAKNSLGKEVHGTLQVSNDMPFRLEVSLAGELNPYKIILYTYATPPNSFAGYPAEFLIFKKFGDDLKPLAKIEFTSVLLATQKLTPSFFNESRFSAFVGYTNVFSNADYYFASKSKTNQLFKLNSYGESGGITNSRSRTVIYICFVLITFLPVVILLIWSARKIKLKN